MEITIEQALHQGVSAHKEGKLEEAEKLYRAILQSQPTHPDANHNLGVLTVSVNKVEAAFPLFKTALQANPNMEQYWLSYIDALIKGRQFEGAKQVLEQAQQKGIDGEKLHALQVQIPSVLQTDNGDSANPSQQQLNSLLGHYQNGRFGEAEQLALSLSNQFPINNFS